MVQFKKMFAISAVAMGIGLMATQAQAAIITTGAIMDGGQEAPPNGPVASPAVGLVTVDVDTTAGTIDLSLLVGGLSLSNLTGLHIHTGAVGVNGNIVLNLQSVGTVVAAPGGFALNFTGVSLAGNLINSLAGDVAGFVTALQNGALYVNAHSPAHPSGEIRGQLGTDLTVRIIPEPATLALMGVGMGLIATNRRRKA